MPCGNRPRVKNWPVRTSRPTDTLIRVAPRGSVQVRGAPDKEIRCRDVFHGGDFGLIRSSHADSVERTMSFDAPMALC